MSHNFQPGDVAVATVEGEAGVRVFRRTGPHGADWAYQPDANRHPGYSCSPDSEGLVKDARPLVVIDPEDREQVERLAQTYRDKFWGDSDPVLPDHVTSLQAALREFADPTPPKPAEPTGLGAVVEVHGRRWVYTGDRDHGGQWWYSKADVERWHEFDSVTTLSEGVTP